MNTIEHEIMDKYLQLDSAARKRIRALIELEDQTVSSGFNFDTWFHEVEALWKAARNTSDSSQSPLDVVELLRDIRDGSEE